MQYAYLQYSEAVSDKRILDYLQKVQICTLFCRLTTLLPPLSALHLFQMRNKSSSNSDAVGGWALAPVLFSLHGI